MNNMSVQVLVSTMDQTDYSLLDRMNIQSDAVVINQCDKDELRVFKYNNCIIKWLCMSKRGIGISRNAALFLSDSDIVLFADDDLRYQTGYTEKVESVFSQLQKADVVCFNINLINSNKNMGGYRSNTKTKRLHLFNSMRYGGTVIAARRKALLKGRLSFSLLFGGGAEFSSGEDSIFIKDCLDAGLKLYSSDYCLGEVDDSSSTWYKGINDAFFRDRGRVYSLVFRAYSGLLYIYYAYKMRNLDSNYGFRRIMRLFREGKKQMEIYR